MKNTINYLVIFALLLTGFFFPTSINGVIRDDLGLIHSAILVLLLLILFLINTKHKRNLYFSFFIIFILLFFTLIQNFNANPILSKVSWGSFIPFIALALLFSTSLRDIELTKFLKGTFKLINLIIIIIGFLIVNDHLPTKTFIYNYYSMGYDELLRNMLTFNKPVVMFGSHSIASMFFYLFFFINFVEYKETKGKSALLLALLNLILIFPLKSVSAYLLIAIAFSQIIWHFSRRKKMLALTSIPVGFIIFMIVFYNTKDNLAYAFTLQNNGFLGRYSVGGVLSNNFEYLKENLLPIGIWISDYLYFTDSGFIIYFLKGSVFLVVFIYLSLLFYFKHHIQNRYIAYTIFIAFLLFEVGYPIITYTRMIFFLPFVVIFLRRLTDSEPKGISIKR